MSRKPVARMPDENLPLYMCCQCFYYEPTEIDHGGCFGVPPTPCVASDGDVMYPRAVVMADDKGCHLWKPRHSA
jgi:hypothetical protein